MIIALLGGWFVLRAFDGESTSGILRVIEQLIGPIASLGVLVFLAFPVLLLMAVVNLVLAVYRLSTKKPIRYALLQLFFMAIEVLTLVITSRYFLMTV